MKRRLALAGVFLWLPWSILLAVQTVLQFQKVFASVQEGVIRPSNLADTVPSGFIALYGPLGMASGVGLVLLGLTLWGLHREIRGHLPLLTCVACLMGGTVSLINSAILLSPSLLLVPGVGLLLVLVFLQGIFQLMTPTILGFLLLVRHKEFNSNRLLLAAGVVLILSILSIFLPLGLVLLALGLMTWRLPGKDPAQV